MKFVLLCQLYVIKLYLPKIEQFIFFLFYQGQDSVAAAVSFTLYNLAAHQSVQEKAYSELESIFKNSNRPTDVKDLQNMKYLEQCIKESMRMYPSVPMISRKLSEDVVLGIYFT